MSDGGAKSMPGRTRAWASLGLRLAGELLVIMLGVSAALWAEGWRQGNEEQRLEALYLERLAQDFEANGRALRTILSESREMMDAAHKVLAFLDAPRGQSIDTMAVLNAVAFAALMRNVPLT